LKLSQLFMDFVELLQEMVTMRILPRWALS
jgi:hypothetical protein